MGISVKITGLARAARELRAEPAALVANAEVAVNETSAYAGDFVTARVGERYNISPVTLRENIFVRRASVAANLVRGSVDMQIKAIPLTEFGAQVRMVPFRGPDSRGRKYVSRALPQVTVALYKGQRPRALPGAFPLTQRSPGAIFAGESVRKRVGADRGRLTGFRFYTFPKRLTDKVLKEAQREVGKQLALRFRVAVRVYRRGSAALRQNG